MAKVLDCSLEESEFELQLCYYAHFRTTTLIPHLGVGKTVSLLFYKDGLGIK